MKEVTKERFDHIIASVAPHSPNGWYYFGDENRMKIRMRVKDGVHDIGMIEFGYSYSVKGGKADQVANKYYVNSVYEPT